MSPNGAMERALYAANLAGLKHYSKEFSRLYFGSEFCQRLMPSVSDLEKAIGLASEKALGFTLVTPYVTNEGLDKLSLLFEKLEKERPGSEVVFNDWGVLRFLHGWHRELEPVMGRLLNKMKRGPRLMNLMDILPPSTIDYFRSCSLDVPLYQQWLVKNGVKRVEFDNLFQGLDINLGGTGLNSSLYTPYGYITTTRLCLAISCDVHGKEDEIGIFPCKKECQERSYYCLNTVMQTPLIRKGNTIFYKNENVPEEDTMGKACINRLVIEPEVPL